jgi:N-methylhydantoinase A
MALDRAAARRAVGAIAKKLGASPEEAALGIVRVVNANMIKGIATVTIQRGIDVRDFSLLSFGGAGGVHAVEMAGELGMAEAVIPPLPGTFSAIGLLVTEMRHDYVRPLGGITADNADLARLERLFQEMEQAGRRELAAQGYSGSRIRLTRMADLKVLGQTYELLLPLPVQKRALDKAGMKALLDAFGKLYRSRYAFFFEGEPIELVNLRLSAEGLNTPVTLKGTAKAKPDAAAARTGRRPVYYQGRGFVASAVYDREKLRHGMRVKGPAVIEEPTSATLIPPGRAAHVGPDLGLFVPLGAAKEKR